MDLPSVQYVTTSDGVQIAYGVSGNGRPLLFLPGTFEHVLLAWQYPGLSVWLERLATRFHLIQFDPRGSGMSSRELPDSHSAADYQRDITSVIDRLQLDRFVIFGVGPGMRVATRFAFEHPERVSALVCAAAGISARTTALFQLLPSQDWDWFVQSLVPRDASPEEARRRVDLTKRAYRQEDFVRKMRASTPEDTRQHLTALRVPLLVLHPRDYALLTAEQAAEVAQVGRGSLSLIDGSTAFGDAAQGISAIDRFLAGLESNDRAPVELPDGLSGREVEVLRLIAAGRSNKQIGEELTISLNTVYRHVSHIFTKTGVSNRAEAASYAHRRALA